MFLCHGDLMVILCINIYLKKTISLEYCTVILYYDEFYLRTKWSFEVGSTDE